MTDAVSKMSALIGPDRVIDDPEICASHSEDIAGTAAHPVIAVVRPRTADEVASAVALARASKLAIVPRGGGMSYSGGYLPGSSGHISFDMSGLDRVIAIDEEAGCVTVEAGCTWAELNRILAEKGLRTPFFGPLSGIAATIGGTLSQNGAFFGAAAHGYAADSVLGLEIVDGTGRLHRIGSWGAGRNAALPRFGPDLVGPFLGDCGALGLKTKAVLRAIAAPPPPVFASFAFDSSADVTAAMAALNTIPHLAEVWAFDRTGNRNLAKNGFSVLETAEMASDIAGKSGSVLGAARNLLKAAGIKRVLLGDVAWSLHVVIEPPLASLQDVIAREVIEACRALGGTVIPDTIPRVTRARPFRTIKAIVGPDGERWLPCHGVFPAALAGSAVETIEKHVKSRDPGKSLVQVSLLLSSVGGEIILEPQLMWPDSLTRFQKTNATDAQVLPNKDNPDQPESRSQAHALHRELIDLLAASGAAHMQVGRSYRYSEDLSRGMREMLLAVKACMDPDHILNPGVLGLASRTG